jgi:ActR/RegA family two-component response regulator
MSPSRVLLVDDDPAIRTSLDEILRKEGFEVTVCASVAESLSEINSKSFDALISDLNIGEPSDGFTVVSAMRRTQPQAITLIMTGFPAFDSALEAIRQQVDAYLLKPTDVRELVGLLRRGLTEHRGKHIPLPRRRLYEVVRERIDDAIKQWTVAMRKIDRPPWSNLTDDELIDGLRVLLEELCYRVESPSAKVREESLISAQAHGSVRSRQNYGVLDLMVESRNLRLVLLNLVHEHLIELNLSNVFTGLFTMSDTLDEMATAAVQAFLSEQTQS